MPLRDHFRPPLDDMRHWEGLHGGWPVMIVASLRRKLPQRYFAEPRVHSGASAEIDVATFEHEGEGLLAAGNGNASGGGIATAVWAPPRPTLTVATDLPAQDVYEVRVYDEKRHCQLVAAVELVSPANKDRPEHRRLRRQMRGAASGTGFRCHRGCGDDSHPEPVRRIARSDRHSDPAWVPNHRRSMPPPAA